MRGAPSDGSSQKSMIVISGTPFLRFALDRGQHEDAAGVRTGLIDCTCGLPTSFVSQWIWSQFTLADHTFVWLSKALYLIFKFAVAHRQSFDDDIRAIRHA